MVKACRGGSSVGVCIAHDEKEYKAALEEAFRYDEEVVIEQYIQGREFSCAVIDGKALPVIEIAPLTGFYDYKNKYQMCIRDRNRGTKQLETPPFFCLPPYIQRACGGTEGGGGPGGNSTETEACKAGGVPVSYTHLTPATEFDGTFGKYKYHFDSKIYENRVFRCV